MNVKKVAGVITLGLILTIPACINHNLRNDYNILEGKINQAQQSILELQDKDKKSKEALSNKDKEINKLEEAIKQKNKDYSELNSLYQKELEPVSYNENNLLEPSKATVGKLTVALKNTALHGLEQDYIDAEKTYGVNAIFLVSLTAQESGWGTSNRARNQNNLSGFEVYSSGSKGACFDSKRESIMTTARLLKNSYLTPNGGYFNGYDIFSVNINYCTTGKTYWSSSINSIASVIIQKINNKKR